MFKAFFDGIGGLINFLTDKLPIFDIDNSMLNNAIAFLEPKLKMANQLFPVKETIIVLSIMVAWSVAMLVFWGVQRAINLLRGAG